MVESGIRPSETDIEDFNNLKMKGLYKVLVLSINTEGNSLQVEFKGDKTFNYDDLKNYLPKDDCRFVVYDFDYETDEKPPRKTSKLVLVYWAPITAPMKRKFTYSSTKNAIKSAFTGIQKDLQPSDWSELERDVLRKELLKA
jgi:cofilin